MLIFLSVTILTTCLYLLTIFLIMQEWLRMKEWTTPLSFQATTPVSIIIPARNEEKNIGRLLLSISQQNYPKELLQIIVIDDHSEDNTVRIAQNFSDVEILHLSDFIHSSSTQSFKKAAIEIAVGQATGSVIIQTDADCWVGKNWLANIVSFYQEQKAKMIAAPVNFAEENSLFERFQSLDFMGMMGVTGAGLHSKFMKMCNGANLAYSKTAFQEVGGLKGKTDLASGDDMFLMHKIAEHYPNDIHFLKSNTATVFTHGKSTLRSFYHQRLRWATKNSSYDDYNVTFVNIIVFFTCILLLISFVLIPFYPLYATISFVTILLGKSGADFFFLRKMAHFFNRKELIKAFIPAQFFHIGYIFIIGIAAIFSSKYEWKGRKVR